MEVAAVVAVVTVPTEPLGPGLVAAAGDAAPTKKKKKKKKKKYGSSSIHNGSPTGGRSTSSQYLTNIRGFWSSLSPEEQAPLTKVQKHELPKRMKEQQKVWPQQNNCSCNSCIKRRLVIEDELNLLYFEFFDEMAAADGDEHALVPSSRANGAFHLAPCLSVRADHLVLTEYALANGGAQLIQMLGFLADQRHALLAKDEAAVPIEFETGRAPEDAEDSDLTADERIDEGKRCFLMFGAKMFEQLFIAAYKEKVALNKQAMLIEEEEEEGRKLEQVEAAKEKKRLKRLRQQQSKVDEKRRLDEEAKQALVKAEALADAAHALKDAETRQEEARIRGLERERQEAAARKREAERREKEAQERARAEAEETRAAVAAVAAATAADESKARDAKEAAVKAETLATGTAATSTITAKSATTATGKEGDTEEKMNKKQMKKEKRQATYKAKQKDKREQRAVDRAVVDAVVTASLLRMPHTSTTNNNVSGNEKPRSPKGSPNTPFVHRTLVQTEKHRSSDGLNSTPPDARTVAPPSPGQQHSHMNVRTNGKQAHSGSGDGGVGMRTSPNAKAVHSPKSFGRSPPRQHGADDLNSYPNNSPPLRISPSNLRHRPSGDVPAPLLRNVIAASGQQQLPRASGPLPYPHQSPPQQSSQPLQQPRLLHEQHGYRNGLHGARFSARIHTRGCHWFPRLFA
jgi:hypothetical protein